MQQLISSLSPSVLCCRYSTSFSRNLTRSSFNRTKNAKACLLTPSLPEIVYTQFLDPSFAFLADLVVALARFPTAQDHCRDVPVPPLSLASFNDPKFVNVPEPCARLNTQFGRPLTIRCIFPAGPPLPRRFFPDAAVPAPPSSGRTYFVSLPLSSSPPCCFSLRP